MRGDPPKFEFDDFTNVLDSDIRESNSSIGKSSKTGGFSNLRCQSQENDVFSVHHAEEARHLARY